MSRQATSRHVYLCAEGVPTYVSNWSDYSFWARNHNKTVVVDDVVFDGSLNLSASATHKNNEGVVILHDQEIAERFTQYIDDEQALLESRGVQAEDPESCRCLDAVDNDGDGAQDALDGDCDSGYLP
jgi:phosphatidylserine/phosphatidylglycerophosphate/cardiolipin synthase-like enzyme